MPSQSVLGLGARAFRGYAPPVSPLFPAILFVDAADPDSYNGFGNIWYDISGNSREVTLPTSAVVGAATGRYIKWVITATKGGCTNGCTSIAELVPYYDGTPVGWNPSATVTNPGGSDGGYPQHRPFALIDRTGNPGSSPTWYGNGFINFNSGPTTLIIDNVTPITFSQYSYVTRWDSEPTDPISWTMSVSDDAVNWTEVSVVTNASITSSRVTETQKFTSTGVGVVNNFVFDPDGFITFNDAPATISMPLSAGYTRYPYNPARWYYSLWAKVSGASPTARDLLLVKGETEPIYGNRFQMKLALPENSLTPTFSQYIWPDQIVPPTSLGVTMEVDTWTHFLIELHLSSQAFTAVLRGISVHVNNTLQYTRTPSNLNGGDFDLEPGIVTFGTGASIANLRIMTIPAPGGDTLSMSAAQRTAIYTETAP